MRYSASRLLVHNLFTCCGIDEQEFHNYINQTTYDITTEYIAETKALLTRANYVDDAMSLLPQNFKTKLEAMKRAANGSGKSGDYFLMTIQNAMRDTYYRIKSFGGQQSKFNVSSSDINLLDEFELSLKYLFSNKGVESICYKTLHEVLKNSEKSFAKKQDKFVRFLLESIFPRIIVPPHRGFLDLLTGYTWDEFVVVGSKLTVNDINMDQLISMASYYNELFDLEVTDYESIGKKFLELYSASLKCSLVSNEDLLPRDMDTKNSVKVQDPLIFDDVIISTHIIDFMRWFPIIAEEGDGPERMEFVERILDCIRDEVCEKLQERYRAKDLIENKTNLFIWRNNDDLRELLVKAMSREQYFYQCFQKYYGVSCLNYVRGDFQ